MKKIVVIGSGYVGLVTGASLADLGHSVVCLDIDEEKIALLKRGKIPFFEPGLEELVQRGIDSKRLSFTSSYPQALDGANYCFLALPTPSSEDESCNLEYTYFAAKALAENMQGPLLIIIKSTVPVGTAEKVAKYIDQAQKTPHPFEVISNPEFLREGSAVRDFKEPKRIVLGLETEQAEAAMRELYAPFADKIVVTDIASAELAKYAANAMLALRLTMIHSFSQLCEKLGADVEAIRMVLGKDPRIGSHYLQPGIGFGGSCLPKDVRALQAISKEVDHDPGLFEEIMKLNQLQQTSFFHKIENYFGSLEGKKLAIWGLSFKPNTDDLREAPSLALCQRFLSGGATLRLYDPAALEKSRSYFGKEDPVFFCESESDAATDADAIVLMTEWRRFSFVDMEKIGVLMRNKVFFDGRNQFTDGSVTKAGFVYFCVGAPSKNQVAYASAPH